MILYNSAAALKHRTCRQGRSVIFVVFKLDLLNSKWTVTLDFNNLMSENDQEINIKSAILIVVTTHTVVLVSEKDRKEQIVFEHLVLYSFVEKMLSTLFFSFNQNFSVIFSTCHTLSSPYLQSIPRLGVWCPFVKIPQLFLSGRLPRLNSPQHPSHVLQ